jgi:peptide/nickel transport system permease protein
MTRRAAGFLLLGLLSAAALAAPALAPHAPDRQFAGYENAPPMRPRVIDAEGRLVRPFVYPLRLVSRLERTYAEDLAQPLPIEWFANGRLASIDERRGPWLPLGGDPLGRDVWARLLHGARLSLGVAVVATLGALVVGLVVGGLAAYAGGALDSALMTIADFILVLPAIFVVLAFRAALPLVLSVPQVFVALVLVLAAAGWPIVARGVRAVVASEARREYAEAAHALGAGPARILLRHLLPATRPFILVTGTMLVAAFLLTESTMSLVGLGFPVPSATWGTMMRDAWQGGALADAPWLMAPALAVVTTVLSLHLATGGPGPEARTPGTFS